jgi:hypothetical protein
MAEPSIDFSDIVQKIADAEIPPPRKRAQATTLPSLLKTATSEYPRATLTAGGIGLGVYSAQKGWKNAYNEGLKVMSERATAEGKMVRELSKKGIKAIPRFAGGKEALHAAAKEYAVEKIFTGFPFNNNQAIGRVADLKTGRVILTGEKVPIWKSTNITGPEQGLASEMKYTFNPKESSFPMATRPKQVTLEQAGKIPKLDLTPRTSTGEAGATEAGLKPFQGQKTPRVSGAPRYTPQYPTKPSIPRRIAELGTSGKLGKFMIGGEALALGADILNEEGDIQRAYREGDRYYGTAGGLLMGGMKTASRAGRGATNLITAGVPEYLGVYDTIDILQARSEARENYMASRDKLKLPVRRDGKDLVPVEGPYLQMFEAQALANRGIASSPIIEDFYKGPDYDYKVHEGKLLPMMKPEYASLFENETDRRNALARRSKNILNVDPSMGPLGWTMAQDPSKNSMLNAGSESAFDNGGFIR